MKAFNQPHEEYHRPGPELLAQGGDGRVRFLVGLGESSSTT